MLYRSIYIGNPAYLKAKDNQMKVVCPDSNLEKGSIAIEDIGILILDHFQITISNFLIQQLMANNVIIISCDEKHLPQALMQPFNGHSEYSKRIKKQISVSKPLKNQLWRQIIESKIKNQMHILMHLNQNIEPMKKYIIELKSGDSTNMEGIAAQYYWKQLMYPDFIRARFGNFPNEFFNFGYAILRSMVARTIVETGLLPVLGIHHKNKYNSFCLADDMMEPFRPFVDALVLEILQNYPHYEDLNKETKAYLLKIATVDVIIESEKRPMMVAIKMTIMSLYKCFTGEKRILSLPEFI